MRRCGRWARVAILAAIAVALALVWSGCFFDTRTPEQGENTDTRWMPATSALTLVSNVQVTLEDQQIGFYARSFRTDFVFYADVQDSLEEALQGRNPFAAWDASVEEQVAQIILDRADRIRLTLTDLSPPVAEIGSDTARIRKQYEFAVVNEESTDTGVEIDSSVYKGTLTFFMKDEAGGWALYRWEDARSPEAGIKSWGKLRGETRP